MSRASSFVALILVAASAAAGAQDAPETARATAAIRNAAGV